MSNMKPRTRKATVKRLYEAIAAISEAIEAEGVGVGPYDHLHEARQQIREALHDMGEDSFADDQ